MAYEVNPKKSVELYVGTEYIQYNSDVENRKQGFINYLKECNKNTLKNL